MTNTLADGDSQEYILKPQPVQEQFLNCNQDIVFYGGGGGGDSRLLTSLIQGNLSANA